jgi:hypothetical protein
MGRGTLNLTRVAPEPAEPSESPQPSPSTPPPHQPQPEESDEKVDGGGGGGAMSILHGALCTAGFLLVLPSGALVARYAKVTGSARAFQLHGLLQFGLGSCRARPLPLHTPLTQLVALSSRRVYNGRYGSVSVHG